ncbi:MAG: glycoside hydrolase family 16 protein [Oscillospiraceae bacterium]|nr:glycoside hydrolase family 16 protein [Oscillospiraceae bacterium]
MKIINLFISVVVLISSLFRVDLGYGMNPTKKTVDLEGYELVWSDDFEGTELDRSKWNDNQNVDTLHWGAVRNGGYWHKDLISVSDGNLHIRTKYLDEETAAKYGGDYKAGWYTGCVTTYQSNPADESNPDAFLYGYFETRCILPAGEGLWSAFWMMNSGVYQVDGSGKDGTEIDVFESFGYPEGERMTKDCVSVNLHWDGYEEAHQSHHVGRYYAENPYTQYNTYGVKWTPEEYIFYINGHECGRSSKGGVAQNPEYLILSVEIAGQNGEAFGRGDITKNTGDVDFIVDYVRVYQQTK